MGTQRRRHYDVTNTVRISHPGDVGAAVADLLTALYPDLDLRPWHRAILIFGRLYAGRLPGYLGCDTWYHDAQHSLDCALAMARLIDGHERSVPARQRLGSRRALLGLLIALFHDAGYIRRDGDHARNGAEFTLTHVGRSAEFLQRYLPKLGFGDDIGLATRLVHFTGYEVALDEIGVRSQRDRRLGFLLGTADVLAQTADCCYLEKCRDFLFREFAICGLAGPRRRGGPQPLYATPQELLAKTAAFNAQLWSERIDGYFGGVHRYLDVHFGGRNPYQLAIAGNLQRIAELVRRHELAQLKRRPVAINCRRLPPILAAA